MNFSYLLTMKGIPIRYHIFFWLALIISSVAALSPYYLNLFKATMHRLVFLPVWILITYLNIMILMPMFWDKGKKGLYIFVLTIAILVLTIIQRLVCINWIYPQFFWMRAPNPQELNPFWIGPFIQFAAFIAIPVILSIGIMEAKKWYEESVLAKQKIQKQQEAELKYLKAQVNPHFLFNNLNNLYGLSLESSKKVPEMILKLSDLLSYSLYESKVKEVTIKKELGLIEDFIELEKARYENRINLNIEIESALDLEKSIAPLLMLPLVENAFKHGVKSNTDITEINISLSSASGNFIFSVKNSFLPDSKDDEHKATGGLGLENLKRRLELLYPSKHNLDIKQTNASFSVVLKLKIDE